ncbi:N-acetylglucosaminyldiphosphoundecaprenol N-acetyl-beta-D-mannosaminyltransferase [Mucilaginibacter frigoritolerans]|uniref:N-acetylglucosaminyldiphosphoundecaprenol N-acetyl-beta-D-mannosaminyltransferase n=1 Tax=Mucilaginibacter frigoritolerans TaxID=652788 RepID=A0A562UFM1_9SPHI|nr:WecB/TagA/CpsF family glycosyltransferase [Mucilaginibacter frigoritolerans]TWJ04626.1 N-acetylglucosaminyldiphosphoundecaprenol N-acetyl-beta-D-mannosaminyltransferase [Mucilaginibacter frigoritolerans]
MGSQTKITNNYKEITCLGYNIFVDDLSVIPLDKKIVLNTINQYSYCIAEKDGEFRDALAQSDILLPDGVGIVLAVKLFTGIKIKKIAGATAHKHLLSELNKKSGRCFYLGSSLNTLNKIEERLATEHPNITAKFYSPPYKPKFNEKDNELILDIINSFKPDVLFVGMTAPKQEKWAYEFKNKLDVNVICSIGAVFDFYAGTVKRPRKFWIRLGLEWFIRLLKEPKRMSKRYLRYGPFFIYMILKKYYQIKSS